jgi:hypothetical protein
VGKNVVVACPWLEKMVLVYSLAYVLHIYELLSSIIERFPLAAFEKRRMYYTRVLVCSKEYCDCFCIIV